MESDKRFDLYYGTSRDFKHEHTRWNSWIVFYIGVIASLFVGYSELDIHLPF